MKNKTNKKFFVGAMIMVMIAIYGFAPLPQMVGAVDAISDASDTFTDSDAGATATHTFVFTLANSVPAAGYIEIEFPGAFSAIGASGDITCPGAGGVASLQDANMTARCTYAAGLTNVGAKTMIVADIDNPAAGSEGTQYIDIYNRTSTDVDLDRVTVAVVIIQDVLMTARVQSTMTFTVDGMTNIESVNGVSCDVDTTATTTDFGTLAVNTEKAVCQELTVTTNADDGYTVTVEQDQELTSDSGSTINSFDNSPDGTGSTTAHAWAVPLNTLDAYHTYGHMGLTSDDADLNSLGGYNSFAPTDTDLALQYAGLNDTDPMPVMHHDGPADGTTQNAGLAHVLYQARIASLQEAGDYENTLTYIATAQF